MKICPVGGQLLHAAGRTHRHDEANMIYDIFVNCNWVVTRWQKYNTHLHTIRNFVNAPNNRTPNGYCSNEASLRTYKAQSDTAPYADTVSCCRQFP